VFRNGQIARRLAACTLTLTALGGGQALAETGPAAPPTPAQAPCPPENCVTIPAGTVVVLQIDDFLGASYSRKGQTFELHLAEPIVVNGEVAVPAGVPGVGEVLRAKRPGFIGAEGGLVIAARYLDDNGVRIPLDPSLADKMGRNKSLEAVGVWAVGGLVPMILYPGGDATIPLGTRAKTTVSTDVRVPRPKPAGPPAG
jgi:hypothetical protein